MRYIFVMVVMIVLSGCVPKMHTLSPAVEGKVIDADTGEALENVKIESEIILENKKRVQNSLTDRNGVFHIDGERSLGIGTLMGGIWMLPVKTVSFSKKGYNANYYGCEIYNTQDGCYGLTIKMYKFDSPNAHNMVNDDHGVLRVILPSSSESKQ